MTLWLTIARHIDEPLFRHAVITHAVFSLYTGLLVINLTMIRISCQNIGFILPQIQVLKECHLFQA